MGRKQQFAGIRRVVLKIGTSSVTQGGTNVSTEFLDKMTEQVSQLMKEGKEVLIVSSGAIGTGLMVLNAKPKPNEVPIKQAASAVGQGILMQKWNDSFQRFGIPVGQILITLADYSDREKALHLNDTISTLLAYGAVPIFNENDALSTKEIGPMFGDNDTLSAAIASRADADLLVILSDIDGLYDANPRTHPDAKFITEVSDVSAVEAFAGGTGSKVGTGGMRTKLKAAKICQDAGCQMLIVSSDQEDVILRSVHGEEIGTWFKSDSALTQKRRWLKSVSPSGRIVVDNGASEAILKHKSLLPVGIVSASGPFVAGSPVDIVCNGTVIARGIADYGSEDINAIRGKRSSDVARILGEKAKHKDVISSENIAILP